MSEILIIKVTCSFIDLDAVGLLGLIRYAWMVPSKSRVRDFNAKLSSRYYTLLPYGLSPSILGNASLSGLSFPFVDLINPLHHLLLAFSFREPGPESTRNRNTLFVPQCV